MNNRILRHPLLDVFVTLAIYECYISNFNCSRYDATSALVGELCADLGRVDELAHDLLDLCRSWDWLPDPDGEALQSRNVKLAAIDGIFSRIVDVNFLSNQPKKIDDDAFFEELIKCSTKAVTDLQKKSMAMEYAKRL
jgi:hypothetical protein